MEKIILENKKRQIKLINYYGVKSASRKYPINKDAICMKQYSFYCIEFVVDGSLCCVRDKKKGYFGFIFLYFILLLNLKFDKE